MQRRFEIQTPSSLTLIKSGHGKENHGNVLVLAAHVRLKWTTNASALDMFHPRLRESLFTSLRADESADDAQGGLDLPVSDLPNIKLTKLAGPLKWDEEFSGYTFRVKWGVADDSDIVMAVCQLKRFEFTLIEGGSVEIEFSISSSADITGSITGRLSELDKLSITASLLAPALVEGDVIDVTAGSGAPGTGPVLEFPKESKLKSKAHRDATAAFLDAQAPTAH